MITRLRADGDPNPILLHVCSCVEFNLAAGVVAKAKPPTLSFIQGNFCINQDCRLSAVTSLADVVGNNYYLSTHKKPQ